MQTHILRMFQVYFITPEVKIIDYNGSSDWIRGETSYCRWKDTNIIYLVAEIGLLSKSTHKFSKGGHTLCSDLQIFWNYVAILAGMLVQSDFHSDNSLTPVCMIYRLHCGSRPLFRSVNGVCWTKWVDICSDFWKMSLLFSAYLIRFTELSVFERNPWMSEANLNKESGKQGPESFM